MSWDVGDVVPLSITIKNAAGQPENAGSVSLTITAPDNTVTSLSNVSGILGVYIYSYTVVMAGRHAVRWVATGANAGSFTDVLDVRPIDYGDFISIGDVKSHLRTQGQTADDDEKLRGFISAACKMIVDRMGAVAPISITRDLCPMENIISLEWPFYPIIAVTSLSYLPNLEAIPMADESLNVGGWYIDSAARGIIRHTSSFGYSRRVRLTYVAGRTPVPANFRLAALELTSHLWRMSQLNPGGGRPPIATDDAILPGSSYALPYTVRQLLGLDKRARAGVWI